MQIQDRFAGKSLKVLARSGLEIYNLVPNFQSCCPLCAGKRCAVRHGLYRRRVLDRDGSEYDRFPIPRFRCRRRGPNAAQAVTFSVLPADLVPRRCLSLPLMLWISRLILGCGHSVQEVLDSLTGRFRNSVRPWFPEGPVIYRVVHLLAAIEGELAREFQQQPVSPLAVVAGQSLLRVRARRTLRWLESPARAAPVVLRYHRRRFPRLLFQITR